MRHVDDTLNQDGNNVRSKRDDRERCWNRCNRRLQLPDDTFAVVDSHEDILSGSRVLRGEMSRVAIDFESSCSHGHTCRLSLVLSSNSRALSEIQEEPLSLGYLALTRLCVFIHFCTLLSYLTRSAPSGSPMAHAELFVE